MKKLFNWLLVAGTFGSMATIGTHQLSSGNSSIKTTNKIGVTNGTDVPEGKYPWFCSVTTVGNPINQVGSGGVLIAPDWVLTAAHVAANFYPGFRGQYNAKMVFGLYDTINYDKSKLEERTAKQIFCWGGNHNVDMKNDIALIQLDKPITDIKPVSLYSKPKDSLIGTNTTVMGFGIVTNPDKSISIPTHMQEASIPVLPDSVINDPRWNISSFDPKTDFLAGVITGNKRINGSKGDSGGPLVEKINGQYVDIGIVSHGPLGEDNWLTPEPAVYTFTGAFSDWMQSIMKPNDSK